MIAAILLVLPSFSRGLSCSRHQSNWNFYHFGYQLKFNPGIYRAAFVCPHWLVCDWGLQQFDFDHEIPCSLFTRSSVRDANRQHFSDF